MDFSSESTMAYKFNSGSSQARDSGALSYGETTSDIADTSAAQRELDATPEQRAA